MAELSKNGCPYCVRIFSISFFRFSSIFICVWIVSYLSATDFAKADSSKLPEKLTVKVLSLSTNSLANATVSPLSIPPLKNAPTSKSEERSLSLTLFDIRSLNPATISSRVRLCFFALKSSNISKYAPSVALISSSLYSLHDAAGRLAIPL